MNFADFYCDKAGDIEVTEEMKRNFEDLGYVIVRSLLNKNELDRLQAAVENEPAFSVSKLVLYSNLYCR